MALYTVGIWLVKPGREGEFVEAWREMADWAMREVLGGAADAQQGRLLRDRDRPNRFISLGPWDSVEAVGAWRAHPGFGERVGRMRDLLDDFTPMTLDDVTAAPPGP